MPSFTSELQRDLNRASAGATAVLIWDWLITLADEVELIWPKPNNAWLKWIYLFTRYYILIASIVSRIIEAAILHDFEMSERCVRVWHCAQVIVALHAMTALEILLMMRVYALYNRPTWMARLFISLVVGENVLVILGIIVHRPMNHTFDPMHVFKALPSSFAYFGFSVMAVQITIMSFTLRKYFAGNWRAVPLVNLIFRDGTVAFAIISTFALILGIYTTSRISYAVAVHPWLLVAISSVTCRIINNMQKVPLGDIGLTRASTIIQFTSFFSSSFAGGPAGGVVDSSADQCAGRHRRDSTPSLSSSLPTEDSRSPLSTCRSNHRRDSGHIPM